MAEQLQYHLDMDDRSRWHIITVHPTAQNSLVYAQEVGDFFSGKDYYTTRQGLDSYLIKLTVAGAGVLEYDGNRYSLQPGTFFWIDCQQPQHYYTDPETGNWRVMWVHFSGAQAKAYYHIFQTANDQSPIGHLPPGTAGGQILEELLTLYTRDHGDLTRDVTASALLCQLFSHCITAVSLPETYAFAPAVVTELKSYLTTHYSQRITLDSLATQFSISKYHMQRQFKKHMGQSPGDFLLAIRIAKAKELLRTTDLPVGEVAFAVGMENASHFISTFRTQVGLPPQKFRQSWANQPPTTP